MLVKIIKVILRSIQFILKNTWVFFEVFFRFNVTYLIECIMEVSQFDLLQCFVFLSFSNHLVLVICKINLCFSEEKL